jgi:hypothetical protein
LEAKKRGMLLLEKWKRFPIRVLSTQIGSKESTGRLFYAVLFKSIGIYIIIKKRHVFIPSFQNVYSCKQVFIGGKDRL